MGRKHQRSLLLNYKMRCSNSSQGNDNKKRALGQIRFYSSFLTIAIFMQKTRILFCIQQNPLGYLCLFCDTFQEIDCRKECIYYSIDEQKIRRINRLRSCLCLLLLSSFYTNCLFMLLHSFQSRS